MASFKRPDSKIDNKIVNQNMSWTNTRMQEELGMHEYQKCALEKSAALLEM
jgi:hypothetical protein